jgi:hypothetical protein
VQTPHLNLERYNIMNWLKNLWARITLEYRYRKKLKELRKRDPFIYR